MSGGVAERPPVGYPAEILNVAGDNETSVKFTCCICKHLIRNAVQGACGHRFCCDCIDYELRCSSNQHITCSACLTSEEGITDDSLLNKDLIYPDLGCRRELSKLSVRCLYSEFCDWTGCLVDFDKHCETDCRGYPIVCDICNQQIPRVQHTEHVNKHRTEMSSGCRGAVDSETTGRHAVRLQHIARRLHDIDAFIGQSAPTTSSAVVQNLCQLEDQLRQLKLGFTETPTSTLTAPPLPPEPTPHASPTVDEDVQARLLKEVELYDKVLSVMDRETSKVTERSSLIEAEQMSHRTLINNINRQVAAAETALARSQEAVARLRQSITSVDDTSYDGVLIWRIDDFARRRQEAVSGQTNSIVSPAFYTARTGYKMCARAYLNGDGSGRATHLSLFFVVARGLYDPLLRWPFRQKVSLAVLDQVNSREHVVETFRPDASSNSFKRPTSELNVASGCPQFMSLTLLTNDSAQNVYVRNDVLFVKIVVDCTSQSSRANIL